MKITFLGTGAADWPLQRVDGMNEFRRLSSALIDGVLLIDPGPQVLEALDELKIDPKTIKYIINTHRHSDHFNQHTADVICEAGAEFVDIADGESKSLGKYTVHAYEANHETCKNAVHFFILDGEKTLFYGLDGAWLKLSEFRAMMKLKPDLTVLDGTIGWRNGDVRIFEHNNLNMVLEMKKTLDPYVKAYAISHMAMTLHDSQEKLQADMSPYGIVAAYDGLTLEV